MRAHIISFDLDGTLVDHAFSTAVWREAIPALVAEKRGLGLEQAKAWVYEQYDQVGEGSLQWYDLSYWFNRFELDGTWRQLLQEHRHLINLFPEVLEVLGGLTPEHGLIILSNASRPFLEEEFCHSGLQEFPFLHVISATSDLGMVKKTSSFYREVCRRLGLDPSGLIHVGDHQEFDYQAPTRAGIRSYFLDRSGRGSGENVVRDLSHFARKALGGG
jgi:HAD superfamily hydrolase (TIGR01493 family)